MSKFSINNKNYQYKNVGKHIDSPFISVWIIRDVSKPIIFPIDINYYTDCVIEWGDGEKDVITNSVLIEGDLKMNSEKYNIEHTYDDPGSYVIKIKGSVYFIDFRNVSHCFGVEQLGNVWGTVYKDNKGLFTDCLTLQSLNTTGFQYSDIKDIKSMCEGCTNLTSVIATGLANVKHMVSSFRGCVSLLSFNAKCLTNVENCMNAWYDNKMLDTFDTSLMKNVISCSSAWYGCSELVEFDTCGLINCMNFNKAWEGCSGIKKFNAVGMVNAINCNKSWDGNNVYILGKTFKNYEHLVGVFGFNYEELV